MTRVAKISRLAFSFIILILSFELSAQKSIQAFQLESPPIIDGIFESKIWEKADSATHFIQMEPQPGNPESEKTIAYFGFLQLLVSIENI